jgi:hypothetical protein
VDRFAAAGHVCDAMRGAQFCSVVVRACTCTVAGRSTGEAYAVFTRSEDASNALQLLNKQYMGTRYIELFEASEADLIAVRRVLDDVRLQGCVVRLRGLPFSSNSADVMAFFSGIQLAAGDDAVVFTYTGACVRQALDDAVRAVPALLLIIHLITHSATHLCVLSLAWFPWPPAIRS